MGAPAYFRNFAAADVGRLTSSLAAEADYINRTLRYQLRLLQARSRQAAQNNPYARRFVNMCVSGIVGAEPFTLQAKAKFANGRLDKATNARIEAAWADWGRPGNCEVTGRWALATVWRIAVRSLAIDGEVFLRKRTGAAAGPHGFALEIIDAARVDPDHNEDARSGRGAICMGIELDEDARPVAYHVRQRRPSQWAYDLTRGDTQRIPAGEILHLYLPDWAEQVRGVPWMYAALLNLVHLSAFDEAAVIAARVGASQMGFITSPDGTPPFSPTGATPGAAGENQAPQIDAEPGSFPVLPPGYEMSGWNPKYPDAAVEPFERAMLRGIAAGLDVAHHNLSGDMSGVNYSSARIAELGERDLWAALQKFVIDHAVAPVFDTWAGMASLTGKLPASVTREKYAQVRFQGRRWRWVDPAKEMAAAREAVDLGIKSRTRLAAEQGDDLEEILDELAAERQMMADRELTAAAPAAPAEAESETETETETEEAEE